MKRLYDERSMQTKASQEFGEKIDEVIRPVFEEYLRQGFCVRDLSHEALGVLRDFELGHILDTRIERERTKRHYVEFRIFCPEQKSCEEKCEDCKKTAGPLGHEINKRYLKSIGRICLCAECSDN